MKSQFHHRSAWLVMVMLLFPVATLWGQNQSQANQKTEKEKKEEARLKSAKKIIDNQDKLKEMSRDDLTKLLAEQMERNAEFLDRDPVLRDFIRDKLKEYRNLKPDEGPPLEKDEKLMGQLKSAFGEDATPQKVLNYGQMQELANRYRKAGEWEKELAIYRSMRDMFKNNRMQYFLMTDSMVRILVTHGKRTEAIDLAIRYLVRFVEELDKDRGSYMLFSRIARAAMAEDDWPQAFQCYRIGVVFRNSPRIKRDVYWPLWALAGSHPEVLQAPPDARAEEQLRWFAAIGEIWCGIPPLKLPGATIDVVRVKLARLKPDDAMARARLLVLINEVDKAIGELTKKKSLAAAEWQLLSRLLVILGGDPRVFRPGHELAEIVRLAPGVGTALAAQLQLDAARRETEWAGWRKAFVDGSLRVARNEREDLARIAVARVRKGDYSEALKTIARLREREPEKLPGHALPRGETLDSLEWFCNWRLFLQGKDSLSPRHAARVRQAYGRFRRFYPKAGIADFLQRSGIEPRTRQELVELRELLNPVVRQQDEPALTLMEARLLVAAGDLDRAGTLIAECLKTSRPAPAVAMELKRLQGRAVVFGAVEKAFATQAKGGFREVPAALKGLCEKHAETMKTCGIGKKEVVDWALDVIDKLAAAKQYESAFVATARLVRTGWLAAEPGVARLAVLAPQVTNHEAVLPALVEVVAAAPEAQSLAATRLALQLVPGDSITARDRALDAWAGTHAKGAYRRILTLNAMRVHYRAGDYALALAKAEQLEKTLADRQDYLAFFRGLCLLRQKRTAAAISQLSRVIDQYPDSTYVPRAKLTIGLACLKAGQAAQGREHLQSLIKNHPGTPEAGQAAKVLAGIGAGR